MGEPAPPQDLQREPASESSSDAAADPLLGSQLGPYRIERQLGEGGMGIVYKAVHTQLGQVVAIKVLRRNFSGDNKVLQRFFNEARAVGMVQHAGLVKVHDYQQTAAGNAYIVMEFLQGESLAARIEAAHQRSTGLPLPMALYLGSQVAAALAAAHAAGVVHCDLKPENVLLAQDGGGADSERAKILDFGIAKFLTATTGKQTTVGLILGTPTYMAPEQCEGRDNLTDRVDVYALGVILYQMLSGRPPFVAQSGSALMRQHMVLEPPPLRKLLPTLPEALHELVHEMMCKTPTARPAMSRVVERLQSLRELQRKTAGKPGLPPRLVIALGIVVVMAGTGAALRWSQQRHAEVGRVASALPPQQSSPPPTLAALPVLPAHVAEEEHRLAAGGADKQRKHKPGKPLTKEGHGIGSPGAEAAGSGLVGKSKAASAAEPLVETGSPTPAAPSPPKPGSRLKNGDIEPDR